MQVCRIRDANALSEIRRERRQQSLKDKRLQARRAIGGIEYAARVPYARCDRSICLLQYPMPCDGLRRALPCTPVCSANAPAPHYSAALAGAASARALERWGCMGKSEFGSAGPYVRAAQGDGAALN